MYKLIISPRAKKELKKLKDTHKIAMVSVLDEIKEDPFSGKPLTRELTGRLSFRVGVYRIIYKVNMKDKIVNVLSAGHRGTIYK
jgi:mRNA interferase RelE/StbE